MRASIFYVTPGKGFSPALLSNTVGPNIPVAQSERRMSRLHRGDDSQLLEARNIIGMNHLDMLHTVTTIPLPIGLLNCFVPIERSPHCTIAATMDKNLQAHFVAQGCHTGEMLQRVDARPAWHWGHRRRVPHSARCTIPRRRP
jgi:hypothetical protein